MFLTQKKKDIYYLKWLFGVCDICHFDLVSLIYIEVWIEELQKGGGRLR